jgi:hypothetical protein
MDEGSAITKEELATADKNTSCIAGLTAKVRHNVERGAQAQADQRQPGVFWMRAFPCGSQY